MYGVSEIPKNSLKTDVTHSQRHLDIKNEQTIEKYIMFSLIINRSYRISLRESLQCFFWVLGHIVIQKVLYEQHRLDWIAEGVPALGSQSIIGEAAPIIGEAANYGYVTVTSVTNVKITFSTSIFVFYPRLHRLHGYTS